MFADQNHAIEYAQTFKGVDTRVYLNPKSGKFFVLSVKETVPEGYKLFAVIDWQCVTRLA